VYDSLKALECVQTFSPDIVVLDIGLPMLSGYEVCKRMRKLPQTRHATLIAMTGYGQKEDLARAFEAGFDHHLVKPADPRELLRLIGRPLHAKPE
jgi:CheY-like chemotaxis protein